MHPRPQRTASFPVGTLPSTFQVDDRGAARFSILLDVPPAARGLEPSLSLEHDSQIGNGPLGVGWSLAGQSAISRCSKNLAEDGEVAPIRMIHEDALLRGSVLLMPRIGTKKTPSNTNTRSPGTSAEMLPRKAPRETSRRGEVSTAAESTTTAENSPAPDSAHQADTPGSSTNAARAGSANTGRRPTSYEAKIVEEIDKLLAAAGVLVGIKSRTERAVEYEIWCTNTLSVVRQIVPTRQLDFTDAYRPAKRNKVDVMSFGIRDFLDGIEVKDGLGTRSFNPEGVFLDRFLKQVAILRAARGAVGSYLRDLSQLVRFELLDSDLQAAVELLRGGYLRSAGVVCGVVLESHLKQVCTVRGIGLTKKKSSLADYNDKLRQADAYGVPQWRRIQVS